MQNNEEEVTEGLRWLWSHHRSAVICHSWPFDVTDTCFFSKCEHTWFAAQFKFISHVTFYVFFSFDLGFLNTNMWAFLFTVLLFVKLCVCFTSDVDASLICCRIVLVWDRKISISLGGGDFLEFRVESMCLLL